MLNNITADVWARISIYLIASTGVITEAIPNPSNLEWVEIIKTPVTLALIILAGITTWLCFRTIDKHTDKMLDILNRNYEALIRLNQELHERPCVRKKDNN